MTVLDTFTLRGKVAVVTGGNRGLGRAFAHALGEAGASIAILARTPPGTPRWWPSWPQGYCGRGVRRGRARARTSSARPARSSSGSAGSTSWSTTPAPASTGRRWRSPRRSGTR